MHRRLLHEVLQQVASAVKVDTTFIRASANRSKALQCHTPYLQYALLALARACSTQAERQRLSEAHPCTFSVPVCSKLVVNASVDVAVKTGRMEQIVVKVL